MHISLQDQTIRNVHNVLASKHVTSFLCTSLPSVYVSDIIPIFDIQGYIS